MKNEEYTKCKHQWIITKYDSEGHIYCGCVKCGLDTSVFNSFNNVEHIDYLTYEDRVMYDFLKDNAISINRKGILCDL